MFASGRGRSAWGAIQGGGAGWGFTVDAAGEKEIKKGVMFCGFEDAIREIAEERD